MTFRHHCAGLRIRHVLIGVILTGVLICPRTSTALDIDDVMRLMEGAIQQQGAKAAPSPTAAAPIRTQTGVSADQIRQVQQMLNDMGYDAGPVDGRPGQRTQQALAAFRRDQGLPGDGGFDAQSLSAIAAAWDQRRPKTSGGSSNRRPDSGPAFDCALASTSTERTICAVPALGSLDRELNSLYAGLIDEPGSPGADALRREQRGWIGQRNRCGADAACLEQRYRERFAVLLDARAATSKAVVPAAGTRPETPPGSALSDPEPGLAPLELTVSDGLPVLGHDMDRDDVGFFRLVALGADPDLLADRFERGDVARMFADTFLADDLRARYLAHGGDWAGGNEFDRADSRERFLRDYAEPLRRMAPQAPFEFIYARKVYVQDYDPERGGFPISVEDGGYAPGESIRIQLDFGWLTPRVAGTWPELFWPLSETEARAALERLAQGKRGPDARRGVLALRIAATAVDPESLQIDLQVRQIDLYDSDIGTPLHTFQKAADTATPATNPSPTDLLAGLPAEEQARLEEEKQAFLKDCRHKVTFSAHHDCGCLAEALVKRRLTAGGDASSITFDIYNDPGQCIDRAGTERFAFNSCRNNYRIADDYDLDLQCVCYAEKYAENYVLAPSSNSNAQIRLGVKSLQACRRMLDNNAYSVADLPSRVRELSAPHPPINQELVVAAQPPDPAQEASLTDRWAGLRLFQDNPDLVAGEGFRQALANLIATEQRRWQDIRSHLDANGGSSGLDPSNPLMVFEWQTERDRRPDFANTTLVDLFVQPRPDWTFLKAEPGFDPGFEHIVQAFVFSRDRLEGREPSFAAQELEPVFRDFLAAAAERSPDVAVLSVQLPQAGYDIAAGMLRFGDGLELLPEAPAEPLPQQAQDRTIYSFPDHDGDQEWRTPSISVGAKRGEPARSWDQAVRPGHDFSVLLALDRRLVLDGVPLPAAVAEQAKMQDNLGHDYSARITVRVPLTAWGQDEQNGRRTGFLVADLLGVEIIGRGGSVLARLEPDSFPLMTEWLAGRQAEETAIQKAREQAEAEQREAARLAAQQQEAADRQARRQEAARLEQEIDQAAIRPDGAFGPDILGLQLGMSLDAAESIIRSHMPVAVVIEHVPDEAGASPKNMSVRVYATADGKERIALYWHDSLGKRLLGAARYLAPPPSVRSGAVRQALLEKYGPPTVEEAVGIFWTDKPDVLVNENSCRSIVDGAFSGFQLVEGSEKDLQPETRPDVIASTVTPALWKFVYADPLAEPAGVRTCPTTLWARLSSQGQELSVLVALFDGAWIVDLLSELSTRTDGGAPIKF